MNTAHPSATRHPGVSLRQRLSRLGARSHLTRFAHLGFWFFLIKGLLWLIVPVIAVWFGLSAEQTS